MIENAARLNRVKGSIRSALRTLGYEVHRNHPNQHGWLQNLGINTVLDIGANTGQFATLARHILPAARIISFEPIPECYVALMRAFDRDSRFSAFNVALGSTEQTLPFHRHQFSPVSSLLVAKDLMTTSFPGTAKSWVTEVEVRTLDGVASTLDLEQELLVKIDVQGYEDRVLAGGHRVLSGTKVVIIEVSFDELYEGQTLFGRIHSTLASLGFVYAGSFGQNVHPSDGRVLEADAIYLRR